MKITTVYAESGDWQGIYVDGELKFQGHEIETDDIFPLLKEIGALVDGVEWEDINIPELVFRLNNNRFPSKLADADKYKTGTHIVHLGDAVELWKDGRIFRRMSKSEYETFAEIMGRGT